MAVLAGLVGLGGSALALGAGLGGGGGASLEEEEEEESLELPLPDSAELLSELSSLPDSDAVPAMPFGLRIGDLGLCGRPSSSSSEEDPDELSSL